MDIAKLPASFKTEDDRIAAMEQYEADGGTDPKDLDTIIAVPLEQEPPAEPVDEDEVEVVEETPTETPVPKETPKETPAETPAGPETPAEPVSPAAAAVARNWVVKEEDIPKETYYDKNEGRERPFITHKNFPDLAKSYIKNQKHTYYVENVLLPQSVKTAEDRVRQEFSQKMNEMAAQLEAVKKAPPAAQEPASPAVVQGTATGFQQAMEDLKKIDPTDSIEHTDKLHAALRASMEHINNLTATVGNLQKQGSEVTTKLTNYEQQSQQTAQQRKAESEVEAAMNNWKSACSLVDTFAATSEEFKKEYGALSAGFDDLTKEATGFHATVAGVLYNKPPSNTTSEERKAAAAAYMRPDSQQLKQQLSSFGIDEPKNYRAWLELDQVDALRAGWYRDPISKEWRRLEDPVTKAPVNLGDMGTAYGRYLDITGKRARMQEQTLAAQRDSMTSAINKRDGGLVSMDTNALRGDGSGAELTEDRAVEILESIDQESAISRYMMNPADRTEIDAVNRALLRLGQQPIDISTFAPQGAK